MIAIGIGCRRGCSAEEIVGLVDETLQGAPHRTPLLGLFSIDERRGDSGLADAAARLALPLTFLDLAALKRASAGAATRSPRVEARFGVPSIAETAALAGAGPGAVLLVARRASGAATCALACAPG